VTTTTSASFNLSRSAPYFALLLIVALIAFWPTYLSPRAPASSSFTHFHALTATLWMLMLIVQPIAILKRRRDVHRQLGRVSYVLAPLVILSVVLLAHSRIRGASAANYAIQTYILYLQISLACIFAVCYGLAIYYRRVAAVHARFMVGTALTLIDPIVIRLMFTAAPTPTWNYQWLTFGLTDLVLIALIWLERKSRSGRWVFPALLVLFVASQALALFGFAEGAAWKSFTAWFADLGGMPAHTGN
jgi:hypothetical protein